MPRGAESCVEPAVAAGWFCQRQRFVAGSRFRRRPSFAEQPWPDRERQEIRDALAQLDANHATVSVRERTAAASGSWEGRLS